MFLPWRCVMKAAEGIILLVAIILSYNYEKYVLWKVSLHRMLLLLEHYHFSILDWFFPEGELNCNLKASFTLHINVFKIIDSFPSLGEMMLQENVMFTHHPKILFLGWFSPGLFHLLIIKILPPWWRGWFHPQLVITDHFSLLETEYSFLFYLTLLVSWACPVAQGISQCLRW